MTFRRGRGLTGVAALALAVGLLAGCTGGDSDKSTDSSTSASGSASATGTAGTDQSSAALGYTPPTALATATSTTYLRPTSDDKVTVSVGQVLASSTGTRVTWWLSTDDNRPDVAPLDWSKIPSIADPKGGKLYRVNIFKQADGDMSCVCTFQGATYSNPHYRTAMYPPLPDGTASVDIRLATFPTMKSIKVTWAR